MEEGTTYIRRDKTDERQEKERLPYEKQKAPKYGEDIMEAIFLMLGVTACYTTTSLTDRYAAHDAKISGNDFTFLMCASMSVFVACSLPLQEIRFELVWQSFAAV